MIADYHIHTPFCGHARGKTIEYVESAIEANLQEIGFSDHLGRYYLTPTLKKRYWDWGMDERNLARYVAEILKLREMFQDQIRIKIGLEIDYIEGAEDLIKPITGQYPFDFFLGSIHCLPLFGWRHLAHYTASSNSALLYREYFRMARSALQSPAVDILAHIDFIWRYLDWPVSGGDEILNDISETILNAKENGKVIEINSNALIWSKSNSIPECDPFDHLLNQIVRYQVPVTLGSDAHDPSVVGRMFPEIISLLQCKGITSTSLFSEGKIRRELLR